ncbi:hypothetical protein BHE90_015294 [Fusarium euwallaceae]|uniref:Uncharacterized protein n=1 Tax=Fusarium euwallaceae TaxID=1147111 RepID=A0A430L3M6_9HYPO|nr:hypothetical protein BHE90_015294 [Fusarium euwallaceae]
MTLPQYQVVITDDSSKEQAAKRRAVYIRPFFIFWLTSFVAELFLLGIGVFVMSGFDDLIYKVLWTLVFCPLGMGGAMGGIVNCFIVDHYYGKKACHFTALITVLVLGSCNYLCYNLDHYFGWFGSSGNPMYFHLRYPIIWVIGYYDAKLLFTDEGQAKLASWGV